MRRTDAFAEKVFSVNPAAIYIVDSWLDDRLMQGIATETALGVRPVEAWAGCDLLCVLGSEEEVRSLEPGLDACEGLDGLLRHVTATASEYGCVSRSFAPKRRSRWLWVLAAAPRAFACVSSMRINARKAL